MNADIYNKIIADHKELSSLPQTLSEVLRIISNETSHASELAEVIGKDPALTVKMLRIVNSPYYGAGREITTLSQAVMTLGTRTVSALALSTSIYDMTQSWENGIDRISFWRHSLETAVAAREIAEAIRYPRIEEAFVAGLLHDIGLLVLEKSFPDKFRYIWNQNECGEQLIELEENTWGTNHARVGQFLLKQWSIPSVICDAVGMHHNSFIPDTDEADYVLPQIVALANRCAKFSITKVSKRTIDLDSNVKDILRKNLKLAHDRLSQIEEHLMKRVVDEASFLEIEIGSNDDILIEANRMLYHHYLAVENLYQENKKMQQEITQANLEKAALETLKTITATFNHYINNATATILGRAQLMELSLQKGDVVDVDDKFANALHIIINGINTIQLVLGELKNLSTYKTMVYHDDTYIINIEKKITERLEQLKAEATPSLTE